MVNRTNLFFYMQQALCQHCELTYYARNYTRIIAASIEAMLADVGRAGLCPAQEAAIWFSLEEQGKQTVPSHQLQVQFSSSTCDTYASTQVTITYLHKFIVIFESQFQFVQL